jgi:hypothetical protein
MQTHITLFFKKEAPWLGSHHFSIQIEYVQSLSFPGKPHVKNFEDFEVHTIFAKKVCN